jgi:hypothetical protein
MPSSLTISSLASYSSAGQLQVVQRESEVLLGSLQVVSVVPRGVLSKDEGKVAEMNKQKEGSGNEQWMHLYGLSGVVGAVWAISSLSSSEMTGVGEGRRRGAMIVAASLATFCFVELEEVVRSLLSACQQSQALSPLHCLFFLFFPT